MPTRKLIIASPAKNGLSSFYFKSFLDLIGHGVPGYQAEVVVEDGNNALNLSRNIIVDDLIHGSFDDEDKMLMLDTDHKWDLNHLNRMLSHDFSKYPIISGTYCKKAAGRPVWLGLTKKGAQPLENGLIECEFLPTGFLCTSVGVLRAIAKDNPERDFYYDDHGKTKVMTELFPIGVRGPRTAEARLNRVKKLLLDHKNTPKEELFRFFYEVKDACYDQQEPGRCVGEDYCFSYLACKAGFTLWIDTQLVTPHVGQCDFPILADKLASPAPIPMNASDTQQW